MDNKINNLIKQYAIRLGDDSIVLGHRISEWCRNGPFLEEDLALQNVALDYIGRARMFYSYAAKLANDGSTEDTYPYTRDCREFQNYLLYELPRGDFAYTMARQLIIDVYYQLFLQELYKSEDETFSAIAGKAIKETSYHLKRSIDWTLRMGDGTDESHNRMQTAFNRLWGYTDEMFELDELEQRLVDNRIGVNTTLLKMQWLENISNILSEATLKMPVDDWVVCGGREGFHTEHLGHLLSELQFIQRTYPGLQW